MAESLDSTNGSPETATAENLSLAEILCNSLDAELKKPLSQDLDDAKKSASTLNVIAMQLRMQIQTGSRAFEERARDSMSVAAKNLEVVNAKLSDPSISAIITKMHERVKALTPRT